MNRLEQRVLPNLDANIPAPVRGAVHITPPDARGPDLSAAQDALHNLARLSVHLQGLREKAQNEADELAMIEFDGWVKREETLRATEFAQLPLADQKRMAEEYRTRFVRDAAEFSQTLDLSDRRRQVVSRLIASRGDGFGARLFMESTRRLEQRNIETGINHFKSLQGAGDVPGTLDAFDRLHEKGINLGMTREQAGSRAAYNNLAGALAGKSNTDLDEQIKIINEDLATDAADFPVGDGETRLLRSDMEKLRDLALKEQHRRFDAGYEAILQKKREGTLDEMELDRMLKSGEISEKLYKTATGELKREKKEIERARSAEARARQREERVRRTDDLAQARQFILDQQLRPGALDFDANARGIERVIREADTLSEKERSSLLATLKSARDADKLFSSTSGQVVARWLLENFTDSETGEYANLGWDPWGGDKNTSQELQQKVFGELRDMAKEMLYRGEPPAIIIETLYNKAGEVNRRWKSQVLDKAIQQRMQLAGKGLISYEGWSVFGREPVKARLDGDSVTALSGMLKDLGKSRPQVREVRRTVDGKPAIFDANTKKFIRWEITGHER